MINSVALNTADVIACRLFVIFHLIHLVGINEFFFLQVSAAELANVVA